MIHVACTADEGYAPHCATMLASLLDTHDPKSICIHYLHPADLSPAILGALESFVRQRGGQMRLHAFTDDSVAGLPSWPGLRPLMWYRVMLPERLPELDRILYIDADAIVLDDLRPLWHQELGGKLLAAVTNVSPPIFADHPLTLGLPDRASYFNSGVMLLNLARMRAEESARRLIEFGRGRPLKWWDQDALNVLFHGERLALHPRWNSMNCVWLFPASRIMFGDAQVDEACRNPAIVHFEGPGAAKPWHFLSKHPFRDRYLHYRAQTPWPLREFEGTTLHNRALRVLPMKGILWVLGMEFRAREWLRAVRRRLGQARRTLRAAG